MKQALLISTLVVMLVALGDAVLSSPLRPAFAQSQADGGLRIYIDPATGQPTDPPPPASTDASTRRTVRPPATDATSTSSEGLSLRQGTTAAGGVILDLGGRFQDEVRVTTQPQGHRVECTRPGTEAPCTDPRGSADAHP